MTPQLLRRAGRLNSWSAAAALFAGVLWTPASQAWNDFGHMTVAAVAWRALTPASRAQVAALLRLNPDYGRWIERTSPGEREAIAFVRAATWADAIKHEAGYADDGERPQGADAAANTGYADRHQHRDWHYVDIPFSPDGTPLPPVPTPNAATRIADFRAVIADPAAPAGVRSYDLVWLIHLVGDIHQPLHAVSRFTHALPTGDLGGNRIRLCTPPCREELHFLWDEALGHGGTEQALALAGRLPVPRPALVSVTDIATWVTESTTLARRVAYAAPIGPGPGPYRLTPTYRARMQTVARERVALAGRRLALLLNRALSRRTASAPAAAPRVPRASGTPP